jgi:hypothetical protein
MPYFQPLINLFDLVYIGHGEAKPQDWCVLNSGNMYGHQFFAEQIKMVFPWQFIIGPFEDWTLHPCLFLSVAAYSFPTTSVTVLPHFLLLHRLYHLL